MNRKPISPKGHGMADYVLVSRLLVLPTAPGTEKKIRRLYASKSLARLLYVALTDQPAALKPVIPFTTHGQIDPFNVAQFALQSFWKPLRKRRLALGFNLAFTAVARALVLLTDWHDRTKTQPGW